MMVAPRVVVERLWKIYNLSSSERRTIELILAGELPAGDDGRIVALRDVSFHVEHDEFFVIMGLSGSGKSTLVRCLIRLIEPTSGRVAIDAEDVTEMAAPRLKEIRSQKVAFVFQHHGLFPHMTALDNAAWALEVRGMGKRERRERARDVLMSVGLDGREQSYPDQLSGGQQQRVGLARALAADPQILLMDEPFSGLDPLIRRQMQDEVMQLLKDLGKTVILITHDLAEALNVGDRIAIMRSGEIVQVGRPGDIVDHPKDDYVGEFVRDVRIDPTLAATPQAVGSSEDPVEPSTHGPGTVD